MGMELIGADLGGMGSEGMTLMVMALSYLIAFPPVM